MRLFLLLIEAKIFTLFLQVCVVESSQIYSGAQLLKVTPENKEHISFLRNIRNKYDFWTEPKAIGHSIMIAAMKNDILRLKSSLQEARIESEIVVSNLEERISSEREANDRALAKSRGIRGTAPSMSWTAFHSHDEIMAWIDSLEKTYPDLVTVENVGKSYEKRTMKLLKISTTPKGGSGKRAIFVDGGIHAREWISPATVTYIINELLCNSTKYKDILSKVDFYFMPLINPDGYAYTFEKERLWRKTRSPNKNSECIGTDPNRNWDYKWMKSGASKDPCSNTYAGSGPFSEIEMQITRDQLMKRKDQIEAYLSFHSFGQYLLYGWGYAQKDPQDVNELMKLARDASKAIQDVHGKIYTFGGAAKLLYPAAGASDDYAKAVANIKYSYTIELRPGPNDEIGFILPAKQIIPCGEESFAAFQVVMDRVLKV